MSILKDHQAVDASHPRKGSTGITGGGWGGVEHFIIWEMETKESELIPELSVTNSTITSNTQESKNCLWHIKMSETSGGLEITLI